MRSCLPTRFLRQDLFPQLDPEVISTCTCARYHRVGGQHIFFFVTSSKGKAYSAINTQPLTGLPAHFLDRRLRARVGSGQLLYTTGKDGEERVVMAIEQGE